MGARLRVHDHNDVRTPGEGGQRLAVNGRQGKVLDERRDLFDGRHDDSQGLRGIHE
jgi:hypothetical protein